MQRKPIFPPVQCTQCPRLTGYLHEGLCAECRFAKQLAEQQEVLRYAA